MRRRLLIAAAIAVAAIPLIVVFAYRAGEPASVAMWYVIWLGNLLVRSLPQWLFWGVLLLVFLALAVASLILGRDGGPPCADGSVERPGQVSNLAASIRRAATGDYFQWRLAGYLTGLILEAAGRGGGVRRASDRLPTGRETGRPPGDRAVPSLPGAPPEIEAYVKAGFGGWSWEPAGALGRLRRRLWPNRERSALALDLESVIQFLEDQLEVGDDRGHR